MIKVGHVSTVIPPVGIVGSLGTAGTACVGDTQCLAPREIISGSFWGPVEIKKLLI